MRVPRRVGLVLVALMALAVALPALAAAATVESIAGYATSSWGMTCQAPAGGEIKCVARLQPGWTAIIRPETGPEQELHTFAQVTGAPLSDTTTIGWMSSMHAFACGSDKEVSAFVQSVAALLKPQDLGPQVIGSCTFYGSYNAPALSAPYYLVSSIVLPPPSPSPTAGPTAAPQPSPTPTAQASATPTPTASAAPSVAPAQSTPPTASAAPTANASPAASASAGPSDSPSGSASANPTVEPTASGIVAGVATGPPATAPPATAPPAGEPPTGGGPATPAPTLPTFESSVLGIEDVNGDGGAIGGSLLLALLMLLIIGFAGELFNNTVENNYDEISGWFRKGPLRWLRRLGGRLGGRLRGRPGGGARVGLLAFLGLTALISSFVDPHFGLDLRSLGEFLGFLVGLAVVLASFKLPPMLARKRRTGELGRLRPLPWALAIAALFVLVSRVGNLQPGYLYGIVLGAIFVQEVPKHEEGRETFYGSLWTLGAAAFAWLGLTWVRSLGYDPNGFGVTLVSTAFAAILVAGLEATAFGLMPLRFLPGHAVYTWNRIGWGVLFGLSIFAFVHLLISPTSGYVSQLSPQAFVAACGVFAAFGALSIVTWGYFRFRPRAA